MTSLQRLTWEGHAECVAEKGNICKILYGCLMDSGLFEGLRVGWRAVLKWNFNKQAKRAMTGLIWLRLGTMAELCGNINEWSC